MEQKDLQVKYTDPLDLIPYENNPRINDYAVKKVMESIKEYGFTNPIIVDADMVIIAGHTRREASILAGLDRVPYIVRDDLTPEQVKAYRIADNKLADLGVDQNVIDRMTQKYNKMLTDHGNTCNKIRDEVYREVRGVKAELAEKETIVRVLTTHIREKELL